MSFVCPSGWPRHSNKSRMVRNAGVRQRFKIGEVDEDLGGIETGKVKAPCNEGSLDGREK